jgi:hypothetical protein
MDSSGILNKGHWQSQSSLMPQNTKTHERTTTAKNMGIHKYHPTSLISYDRCWPLACLDALIKPNQASHQGARWTSSVSMLEVPVLALIIETSAVWPRISHDLSHGVTLMYLVGWRGGGRSTSLFHFWRECSSNVGFLRGGVHDM